MIQIIDDKKLYGCLLPYVENDDITDINWNGRKLWIDDLNRGRYPVDDELDRDFIEHFCRRIADIESTNFNKYSPVLEAETKELRIVCTHESVSPTGTTISIRKAPAFMRMSEKSMLETNYADKKMIQFLKNTVKYGMNSVVCGIPGVGKTELLKSLTNYIPAHEKVITIEDQLELHYPELHPDKDCTPFKIGETFSYIDALKESARLLPKWILVTEVRSIEVRYLFEALSFGTHGMTTMHLNDLKKLPLRVLEMYQDSEDYKAIMRKTYNLINVGILVQSEIGEKITRKITQVALYGYDSDTDKGSIDIVFDKGKWKPVKEWPEEYRCLLKGV